MERFINEVSPLNVVDSRRGDKTQWQWSSFLSTSTFQVLTQQWLRRVHRKELTDMSQLNNNHHWARRTTYWHTLPMSCQYVEPATNIMICNNEVNQLSINSGATLVSPIISMTGENQRWTIPYKCTSLTPTSEQYFICKHLSLVL